MGVPTVQEVFDDIRSYMEFLESAGCIGADCSKESLSFVKNWGRGRPDPVRPSVVRKRNGDRSLSSRTAGTAAGGNPVSIKDRGLAKNNDQSPKPAVGSAPGSEFSPAELSVPDAKPLASTLEMLGQEMENCDKCPLKQDSPGVVTGWGSPDARVVFVTGVPDSGASAMGNPFAGESGALLDRMVKAMHLPMESVFYTSIVRCFPGGNTHLLKQAFSACMPYFWKQMGLVKPDVIVTFGTFASCAVTGRKSAVSAFRGQIVDVGGTPVMPTHHPSELIRDASLKRPAWGDLKQVMGILGIQV